MPLGPWLHFPWAVHLQQDLVPGCEDVDNPCCGQGLLTLILALHGGVPASKLCPEGWEHRGPLLGKRCGDGLHVCVSCPPAERIFRGPHLHIARVDWLLLELCKERCDVVGAGGELSQPHQNLGVGIEPIYARHFC